MLLAGPLFCFTEKFAQRWVSWYQNVSILDFIGAKVDGGDGDNWSYRTCKAPVKLSPPTNQEQTHNLSLTVYNDDDDDDDRIYIARRHTVITAEALLCNPKQRRNVLCHCHFSIVTV